MLFVFSILLTSFVCGEVIQPDIVNSTGEYYIATSYFHNFQFDTIECNSSRSDSCYVICEDDDSCKYTTIRCSSDQCIFRCIGYQACSNMNIDAKKAKHVELQCNGDESCTLMDSVHFGVNTSFLLSCTNFLSCYYSSFWISPLTNHTKIDCSYAYHDFYGTCYGITLYVPQSYQDNFLYFTVNNTNILDSDMIDIRCTNKYGRVDCTNYTSFPIFEIATPSIVNQSGIYYISKEREYYRYKAIILNESNNHYIECNHHASCYQVFVGYTTDHAHCNMVCNEYESCLRSVIHSTSIENDLSVACNEIYSCEIAWIKGNLNKIILECNGQYSCQQIYVMHVIVNELTLNCSAKTHSCDQLYISLEQNDVINVYCYYYTCSGLINATNSKIMNAMFRSHYDNRSAWGSLAIYGPMLYQHEQVSFALSCIDYGCLNLNLYLLDGLNDVDVYFGTDNGCSSVDCNSTGSCISEWNIYCDIGYSSSSGFDGNSCSGDVHDCCSGNNSYDIKQSFNDYRLKHLEECIHSTSNKTVLLIIIFSGIFVLFVVFVVAVLLFLYFKKKRKKQSEIDTEYGRIN